MITKHDTVYIAGPMTGKPNYNFQAFNEAESYLSIALKHATMLALELCTKLYLLNGWEESKGAIREVAYAIKNNMQIIKQDCDFNKCSQ